MRSVVRGSIVSRWSSTSRDLVAEAFGSEDPRPQFDTLAEDFAMQESRHDLGLGLPRVPPRVESGTVTVETAMRELLVHIALPHSQHHRCRRYPNSGEVLRSRRWSSGSPQVVEGPAV
jgi:hypothetical protein